MIKRITSFTTHRTAEGMRIAYTYSVIDENGNLVESNKKATLIVMDDNINLAIETINNWLFGRIPQ